ncbi:MAG TPA: glycoside hydrolase family 47 protein, partial [Balneolales bacterium]|nr:glycoside hydrolase family 47 protein [Balneolales bacterium]
MNRLFTKAALFAVVMALLPLAGCNKKSSDHKSNTATVQVHKTQQPTLVQTVDKAAMAKKVKAAFIHAWDGYKKYAWGHDELKPL